MSLIDQILNELANEPQFLEVGPRQAYSSPGSVLAGGAGLVGLAAIVNLNHRLGPLDGLWFEQISGRVTSSIANGGTISAIGCFLVDQAPTVIMELGQATLTTLTVASTAAAAQNSFAVYPSTKLVTLNQVLQLLPSAAQSLQVQLQVVINAAAAGTLTAVLDVFCRVVRGIGQ